MFAYTMKTTTLSAFANLGFLSVCLEEENQDLDFHTASSAPDNNFV